MRLSGVLPTAGTRSLLRVHRNQPFEFIAPLLSPFLSFSGRTIEISMGDYDDSLSLVLDGDADVELIWMDFDRYRLAAEELSSWFCQRVEILRGLSSAPILLAAWPGKSDTTKVFNSKLREWQKSLPGVHVLPVDEIADDLGEAFFDHRMSSVGATRMSERANVTIARQLSLCWLQAVVAPRLKAVVFDLDNTLWGGVLGEDGIEGVKVDDGFGELQRLVSNLADSGMFVALLSRNDPEDVEAIFSSGRLALPAGKIAAKSISWASKAQGMAEISDQLRIGFDSILFVDDNPGELAAVSSACPGIHTLLGEVAPADTARALKLYPGLFSWGLDETDKLRSADLALNEERNALRKSSGNARDYMASLDLEIRVAVDPLEQRERLHSLSQKTNQFNLALRRLSAAAVANYLSSPHKHAVAVWMTDRFSASGLVGAIFLDASDPTALCVDELCISCRALGRGVEDAMIVAAIDAVVTGQGGGRENTLTAVRFSTNDGPRNGPAINWLRSFSGADVEAGKCVKIAYGVACSAVRDARSLPVRIERGLPDAG